MIKINIYFQDICDGINFKIEMCSSTSLVYSSLVLQEHRKEHSHDTNFVNLTNKQRALNVNINYYKNQIMLQNNI